MSPSHELRTAAQLQVYRRRDCTNGPQPGPIPWQFRGPASPCDAMTILLRHLPPNLKSSETISSGHRRGAPLWLPDAGLIALPVLCCSLLRRLTLIPLMDASP